MTVNKITTPPTPQAQINKINEIISEKQDSFFVGKDLAMVNLLPAGYTRLEYIDGTGLSRYINTNLLITPSMNFYFKGAHISGSGVDSYFGTRNSTITQNGVMLRQTATAITVDFFGVVGTRWTIGHTRQDDEIIEFRSNNLLAEVFINGTSLGTNQFTAEESTLLYPLLIKALNNGGSAALGDSGIRIYRFTINGVCDLIPARRNSDNAIGMYDIVSKNFFMNAGIGSFVGGQEFSSNLLLNFTNDTGYITSSSVGNATLTITQGGTTKGTFTANASSDVTIALDAGGGGGSVDIDGVTITKNSSDEIQTVAVKDDRSGNAIKTWTGTKAQYDAIVSKDSNTQYTCTDSGEIYLGTDLIANKAGNRNIGEIVSSTTPLTDAGLHLLDGTLINGSGIYSAFVTHIAGLVTDYPDLFETEANWQSAVSTYGVCGKFVYDSVNNTVRLPKYGTQIFTKTPSVASTVPVVGDGMTLGLTRGGVNYGMAAGSGVLYYTTDTYGTNTNTSTGGGINAGNVSIGVTSDSSKSGIIAVTSSLLTDYPLDCYYYIVIVTTTKTDIEVDIDEVVTDLNGKADVDLTNVNNSGTSRGASWAMPSDTYSDITIGANGSTYTAPANGYFCINGKDSGNTGTFYCVLRNQTRYFGVACANTATLGPAWSGYILPALKGDSVVIYASGTLAWNSTNFSLRFYYAQGSESEA